MITATITENVGLKVGESKIHHSIQFSFTAGATSLVFDMLGKLNDATGFAKIATFTADATERAAGVGIAHISNRLLDEIKLSITTNTGGGTVTFKYIGIGYRGLV